MEKLFWISFVAALTTIFNLCEPEMLQKEQREKRQIFYRDITARPRSFRSRAEEKDETDRTGHLPLESHYPSEVFNENYDGELVGSIPHFQVGTSYDSILHETSKPSIFSAPTYEGMHEAPHYNPKPIYKGPPYKPKPFHIEPHYTSKPVYEEAVYKPIPSYEVSSHHDIKNRPLKNKNSIPGIAGEDYPIYKEVPYTSFSCVDVPHRPGMYANPEAACQAYHVCHDDRHGAQGASFLCTNGTVFNQKTFSCDWWYNVDCNQARSYYGLNSDPHHNPYSQKPYFEEQGQYSNDAIVHLESYRPSFREGHPNGQYEQPINPIKSQSGIKAKQVSLPNRPPQQHPSSSKYKAPKDRVSNPEEMKKSNFNIESNYGSFVTPFSFGNEEKTQATKKEKKIIQKSYSVPLQRQTATQTKLSEEEEDKLNYKLPPKFSLALLEKTSQGEPAKSYLQIQDETRFPESKDIYSRKVVNRKTTADSQFRKPQLGKEVQQDQTDLSIAALNENIRIDKSDLEDQNFEWGEKI